MCLHLEQTRSKLPLLRRCVATKGQELRGELLKLTQICAHLFEGCCDAYHLQTDIIRGHLPSFRVGFRADMFRYKLPLLPMPPQLMVALQQRHRQVCVLAHSFSNAFRANVSEDASFEVLGAPYSLLSATLSASQNLYTRRGTLVGLSGSADHVRCRAFGLKTLLSLV